MLVVAFCSPYWLKSYDLAYLEFKSMGLWEFCFDGFHYYKHKEDVRFYGCDYIFSFNYRAIRQWMLPGWLQVVQTCVSVSLLVSIFSLLTLSLVFVRWPLMWWRRNQYEMVMVALVSDLAAAVFLALALLIFGTKSWDRNWLRYPQYNYFSWSFYAAFFSMLLLCLAALLLLKNALYLRRVRHLRPPAMPLRPTSIRSASLASYQYRFPSAASVPAGVQPGSQYSLGLQQQNPPYGGAPPPGAQPPGYRY